MITTIYGDMDETTLIKTEGVIDNDDEYTTWVEYRRHGDPELSHIHRSVHITCKKHPQFITGPGSVCQ